MAHAQDGYSGPEVSHYHQPGLEVVPNDEVNSPQWSAASTAAYPGPEVVPQEYNQKGWSNAELNSSPHHADPYMAGGGQPEAGLEPVPPYQEKPKRSKRWIWIAIAVGVVVVVGAVVGGVVGSRANRNTSSSSTSTPATDPPSSTTSSATTTTSTTSATTSATPQSIRPNSKLTVTGWLSSGDVHINLFYQDPNDNLRYSNFVGSGNWSAPIKTNAAAGSKTGVGATSIMWYVPPQIEFFYFNDVQELSGQNFRVGYTSLAGATDSINDYAPVAGDSGSRVAAYWPFTAFQNTDGSLELVTYMIYSPWANQTLPITASKGTGLAIVPQTASFVAPYTSGLLYRTEDGELGGYWLTWNETGTTWDMGSKAISIPETSAIAAFAVARQTSASMNYIYVLYQDSSNVIQYVSYNADSGWSSPQTQSALADADSATDITCLTESAWGEFDVTLSTTRTMSRCYFQSGGLVKEVIYDGSNWGLVGFVPMT